MSDQYHEQLGQYLDNLVPSRPAAVREMEAYAGQHNFPIIGPVSGHYCYQVARMIGARQIFELGSGYGYSAAWFAKAVQENGGGEVHHVVWDERLSRMARQYMEALGFGDIVKYQVAEAVSALEKTAGPFDLIFNDIDKEAYPDSLDVIERRLRPGGVLITDNAIWSGRVFDPIDQSPDTVAIREFTRRLTNSDRWISSIVPVGDGLLVAYKK